MDDCTLPADWRDGDFLMTAYYLITGEIRSFKMAIDREKIRVWAMYLYTVLIVIVGFMLLAIKSHK
jgi:hypothetical protein